MTPNTSIDALGRNSEHLAEFEVEEEQLRGTHLVKSHEASYQPSQTPSNVAGGAHGTQSVHWIEVQQGPSTSEDRDRFLRFRDEWVRNRARGIRQALSISFKTCSEDTASIMALNEFYKWRVFDGFNTVHGHGKVLETGTIQLSRNLRGCPKAVATAEELQICRNVRREKGRQVFRKTCRWRAKSRV